MKNEFTYSTTDSDTEQVYSKFTGVRGVNSVYDENSNITSRTITTSAPFVQSYTYNDDGNIETETRGTDTYSYTYDDEGRITEIKKNGFLCQSYEYDNEGQLVRENNVDTDCTILYNYDGFGNITSKVSFPYTISDIGTSTSTISYIYGDNNWKDKLTSFNGQSISYDAIGNPTNYRGATCTYFGRQLQSYTKGSTSVSYKYDGNGLRTSKTVNGVQHDFFYVDGVLLYEKNGNDYELFYRYDNEGKLSMIVKYLFSNSTNYYYNVVTNTQGDVVTLLNGSGEKVVNYTYDSWGKLISVKNANGATITNSSSIAHQNSIRYRGYVYDNETELYYLQSRYYDPQTGRFINCDDVNYIGITDTVISYNPFAYCENNPVNNSDPSGLLSLASLKKH